MLRFMTRCLSYVLVSIDNEQLQVFDPSMITPWGVLLLRRAPDNDRDEDVTRDGYEQGMYTRGFNLDGRSPMVTFPVPHDKRWCDDDRARLLYGAATCFEAWLRAKAKQPLNPYITITEQTGFNNVIDLHPRCPRVVLTWVVNEFNAHQSGSMFNLQQYQAKLHEYHAAWRDHMKKKGWDWDSFGTGETSQDNRCWAFLKALVLLNLLSLL